jgi:hypothetical protein
VFILTFNVHSYKLHLLAYSHSSCTHYTLLVWGSKLGYYISQNDATLACLSCVCVCLLASVCSLFFHVPTIPFCLLLFMFQVSTYLVIPWNKAVGTPEAIELVFQHIWMHFGLPLSILLVRICIFSATYGRLCGKC